MEEINKAYATFEERDRIASLGGGVDKIEKQHESGKMTARERIEMLLDKGTFVELDKLMVHRCTNYGMDKNKIPGDGIVSGYGRWTVARCLFTLMTLRYMAAHCQLPMLKRL